MGVVYEAEQRSSKRTVALKMMRSFFFAHEEDIARFRTEAEAVARLDHAHIVPIRNWRSGWAAILHHENDGSRKSG